MQAIYSSTTFKTASGEPIELQSTPQQDVGVPNPFSPIWWFVEIGEDAKKVRLTKEMVDFDLNRAEIHVNKHGVVHFATQEAAERLLGLVPEFNEHSNRKQIDPDYMKGHVTAVADKFLQKLAHDFGSPQTYALVCLQNLLESDPRVCHSHDYIDANMTMADAVGEVLGVDPEELDVSNTNVMELWNQAWDAASGNMCVAARTKLLDVWDKLSVMDSVHAKAPSLGLAGREAVLVAGQQTYGDRFAGSDAFEFVVGLHAIRSSSSKLALEPVAKYLAEQSERGDIAALNLRNVVVNSLTVDAGGNQFVTMVMVDAYLGDSAKTGDESAISLRKLLHETIADAAHRAPSGYSAYEATEEDVANVLRSNAMAVSDTNGKSFDSMAAELFPDLDFALIEQATLLGDDLAQQTDYANDEIARQLRVMGVLEPLKAIEQIAVPEAFGPLFEDAFQGLVEHYPSRLTPETKEAVKMSALQVYRDTGNAQNDYEAIRNGIEAHIARQISDEASAELSGQEQARQPGPLNPVEQLAILQAAMERISQAGIGYSTSPHELRAIAKEALKDAGLAPVRAATNSRDDGPSP